MPFLANSQVVLSLPPTIVMACIASDVGSTLYVTGGIGQ
jgi:hypothetical protein